MKVKLKIIWGLVRKTVEGWGNDDASQLAAAIAYYTIFSIAPLLMITLAIAGHFFNTDIAQNQLIAQIGGVVGPEATDFIKSLLENSTQASSISPIASIFGVIVMLAGASGLFFQIQSALNKIWNVPKKQTSSFRHTLRTQFVSYLMVLAIGFLLLIFLIFSGVMSLLIGSMSSSAGSVFLAEVANFLVLFITITFLFAIIYRMIPDKNITWKDVWLGSAVTALLFILGRYAIGFYLSLSQITTVYGAAGSLVVLLLWIYYSAQVFLLGAEFTHTYSLKLGSQTAPEVKPAPEKELSTKSKAK